MSLICPKLNPVRLSIEEKGSNLYHTLDILEDMFQTKAEKKNLRLIFSRNADVPKYVAADKTRLRQVLINLVGNAVKFTERGTG